MIAAGREAVDSADIVKLSGEELAMLSGTGDTADGRPPALASATSR